MISAFKARQRGFTMIEMLFTAFILAIGILGLGALQVMALKTNANGRTFETAIAVGNRILDAAANESRVSWNNMLATTPATLPAAVYLNPAAGTTTEYYDFAGTLLGSGAAAPAGTIFTAVTTSTAGLAVSAAQGGRTTIVRVVVSFNDAPTHVRTVTLQRSLKSA
ncbi:type IV pilus modification PilV family protein [Mesoterricola silvestris]|uniref:Prepilin-type N-terminal cleavage/methylation domain-containing protein n=1 Tax=Mesoterricola silvestris TaxID=2927979 RepID=A0AA48K9E3_9BACT|nr:prepilin-type N-terminal cleavage/methylation domain-containing protein [Mesoterricola silvestris]BDU73371.1 hypothetical protein METEAL_25450 [Mesoterricola silvestris]